MRRTNRLTAAIAALAFALGVALAVQIQARQLDLGHALAASGCNRTLYIPTSDVNARRVATFNANAPFDGVNAAQFAHWITPGNMAGLAAGAVALLAATWLPPLAQRMLAALALLLATVLVNLAPENPYLTASLAVWQQGHFLNFNGLTRLVSSLWPFAALPFLMLPRPRTREHP